MKKCFFVLLLFLFFLSIDTQFSFFLVHFCSFVWDDRIAAGTLYEQQKQREELNFRSEQNRFFVNASCRFHLFCKRAHDGIVSVICLKTKHCSKDIQR